MNRHKNTRKVNSSSSWHIWSRTTVGRAVTRRGKALAEDRGYSNSNSHVIAWSADITQYIGHVNCTFIPSISEIGIFIRNCELHDLFPSRFHPNLPSYLFMFIAFHQSSIYRFDSHAWFDFSVSKDKSHYFCFLFPVFGFRFCFTFTFGRTPVCSCCLSLLSFINRINILSVRFEAYFVESKQSGYQKSAKCDLILINCDVIFRCK